MKPDPTNPPSEPVRAHVFDGISEYDKRLPNWWLYTLYGAIAYAVIYWGYYQWLKVGPGSEAILAGELAAIETQRLSVAKLDDQGIWKMSQNTTFVDSGKAIYLSNCAACHLPSLKGKSENVAAIGPDLTDTLWIHGGKPTEVYDVIAQGVQAKGMPTWGPVLGAKKIGDVTAYLLSHHREGEPIQVVPAPAP